MNDYRLLFGLVAFAAIKTVVADTGDRAAQVERGQQIYVDVCAPCHGRGPGTDGAKMLPGTAALDAKYRGTTPAALEDRIGLSAEALRYFIRNGIGAMPMFRKTEVTDNDIEAIAAYLARSAQQKD
jgi:mono/diheme cytochrome c family protein